MIVSHSRRFIFLKSRKTAGTSLETALSNFCSGDDIVTPLGDYEFNKDRTGKWQHKTMNAVGFEQHDDASTIRGKIDPKAWDGYHKFSITRNPWDRVVSLFTWRTRNQRRAAGAADSDKPAHIDNLRRDFSHYVRTDWETNDAFYFLDDRLCTDQMLRYEQLQDDVAALCHKLGLPHIELPRLKTGFRSDLHYSMYYDDETKAVVAARHARDIEEFGYRFESA